MVDVGGKDASIETDDGVWDAAILRTTQYVQIYQMMEYEMQQF